MPHVNMKKVLIVAAIVLLTLKFRAHLLEVVARVPVVGPFIG